MSAKPKKKAEAKKRKSIPDKESPVETGRSDNFLAARYGEDARNPVMWDLINAKHHLETCRALEPKKPLADAMFDRAEQQGRDSVHWGIRIGFYETTSKAILAGDSGFFREVARLLETRVDGTPERRFDLEVEAAFNILRERLGRSTGKLPTKKQVKELALWNVAFSNVLDRMTGPNPWDEMHHFPGGNERARLKPDAAKQIEKEIERLPEQNWTAIFKRCGLANLPNDKGGQPSHRRRRYCR